MKQYFNTIIIFKGFFYENKYSHDFSINNVHLRFQYYSIAS